MLDSFLLVGQQVLILLILILVGFFFGKKNWITKEGSVTLSNLMLYVVSPSMVMVAFQRKLVPEDLKQLLFAIVAALFIHIACIVLSALFIRDKNPDRRSILRFATVFANCGFMAYPLQNALFGTVGIFYGSAYVFIFTILIWTWGTYEITHDHSLLKIRPLIFNAGVISVILSFLLYVLEITIPPILMTPITYLSSLNTPVPMLLIGYQLSKADFRSALSGKYTWISMLIRLFVMPVVSAFICAVVGLPQMVALILIIASSTPPAAFLNMLVSKYDKDISLAASVVSVQTVISIFTMPIMYSLVQVFIH